MQDRARLWPQILVVVFGGTITAGVLPDCSASAASNIYYCPDRKADQQYSAQAGPGCLPLVDRKQDKKGDLPSDEQQRHFQSANISQDVTAFLTRYQKFLACCKTDLGQLREIEDMADELDQLLASTQANLSN